MRSPSTRPSSTPPPASPAPPIETSQSVASSAAATSSASGASASRALPWTPSSVRLKTTFGSAPDVGELGPELVLAQRAIRLPRALAVGDEAVHRDAHRVDQH